jgi:hypothetical protein
MIDLPSLALGVSCVHAMEVGREQRGLIATGAGSDFDNGWAIIEWVVRDEEGLELGLGLCRLFFKARHLGASDGRHLGIIGVDELARLAKLVVQFEQSLSERDELAQSLVFTSERAPRPGVAHGLGIE